MQKEDLVDIELHGFTHVNPDVGGWLAADDRYEAVHWYRELGQSAAEFLKHLPNGDHPLSKGVAAIKEYFDKYPTALVCPGDEWTNEVLEFALSLDLRMVSSYYQALRYGDRFCWTYHVCAPYFDKPDAKWFDSPLPVVGYLHDRDIAVHGLDWFVGHLDRWIEAGAKRFIYFRDLSQGQLSWS